MNVTVGDKLPPLDIPLTRTLIASAAIATRDYTEVHHDHEIALERGSPDVFMNILTSNGLVGRFVTDWAGPAARVKKVSIRLGAPNYPGDTMHLTGEVTDIRGDEVTVRIVGSNSLGDHVTGFAIVTFPETN
jgi:acyl dehydratase